MRITLLNPPFFTKGAYYFGYHFYKPHPNPALAILSTVCRHNNVVYQLLDAKLEGLGETATIEKITLFQPDVICITIPTTAEAYEDFFFIQQLKTRFPFVKIVCGGPHITALPKRSLEECSGIDIASTGFGDDTLHRLINADFTNFTGVAGIFFRTSDDGIVATPASPRKESTAFPRIDWTEFPPAHNYMVFQAHGCPFSCNYCFNITNHLTYFTESVDVLEELQSIYEYAHPEYINFADPTFAVNRKRTVHLLNTMVEKGWGSHKQKWRCYTRTDMMDEPLLGLMKKAGCDFISYGIESGSPRILQRMRKNTSLEKHFVAVAATKKVGIRYQAYFVFGHIGETPNEVGESINLIIKLNPQLLGIGVMVPWPGTEVYECAVEGREGLSLMPVKYPEGWQLYDKHLGHILQNNHFKPNELERLRLFAYLKLYVYNLRFLDLLRFGWEVRNFLFTKLDLIFKKSVSWRKTR